MAALPVLAAQFFQIRPDEVRRTGLSFVYLFACIGAFIVARIVRTVLFLEIPNYKDQLPLTYIGISITVSWVMYAYSRVERRLRRDLTNLFTLALLTSVTLAFRWLLSSQAHWVYWCFYIWVEIFGSFLIVQFWSFVNEIFHARQAKRLFAVIGGGGVLANIAFGFGTQQAAALLGTENLLYIICVCFGVCAWMVWLLSQSARAELMAALERPKTPTTQRTASGVFATRHVKLIAAVIVLTYLVSTLVDYQFQVIVGDSIAGKEPRSAYFGAFFGVTGVLAGLIQFFLTSRLLERFGVLIALSLLPCGMLMGSIGLLLTPGLALAGFTKGAENVLRYTIHDSTLQLRYLPVPSHLRGRAKAFIDGILKPVSIGGAGLLLALLVGNLEKLLNVPLGLHWPVEQLSVIVSAALIAWLGCTIALKREYLKSLVQTLQHRRLDFADAKFGIHDESTLQALSKSLGSPRAADVVHSLELLSYCEPRARSPLVRQVVELLSHANEQVREAALHSLVGGDQPMLTLEPTALEPLLRDPAPGVRAAAAQAMCAMLGGDAFEPVTRLLADSHPRVRAAAMAGLIRYGGLDGVLVCADPLKRMLNNLDAIERQQAGWILGEVGVQNFFQPLVGLLADVDPNVRRVAATAAGKLKSSRLLLPLTELLGQPRLGNVITTALVAYGDKVVEPLRILLADPLRSAWVRAHVCRVLARLGANAASTLVDAIDDEAWHVRSAAVAALSYMMHRHPEVNIPRAAVDSALRRECVRAYEWLALLRDLELGGDTRTLLADAVGHRLNTVRQQVLALIGLKYDAKTVDLVLHNLGSTTVATRANAVEVLDNMLSKDEKPLVIPLFDDAPIERVLHAVHAWVPVTQRDRGTRLAELLASDDPWLQSVATHAIGVYQMTHLLPMIEPLLRHSHAVCRETALLVLRQFGQTVAFKGQIEPLLTDPVGHVSRFARHVLDDSFTAS